MKTKEEIEALVANKVNKFLDGKYEIIESMFEQEDIRYSVVNVDILRKSLGICFKETYQQCYQQTELAEAEKEIDRLKIIIKKMVDEMSLSSDIASQQFKQQNNL